MVREDVHAALAQEIAALREYRGLLRAALDRATDLDAKLERMRRANPADDELIMGVQAELLAVAGQLGDEQRALGRMLAYLLLAMRRAASCQRVAILSLRDEALERELVAHLADRLRAIASADEPPPPRLIHVAVAADVPANRAQELVRMRDEGRYRRGRLVALRSLLERLPASVAGVPGIASAMRTSRSSVTTTRGDAIAELTAVDPVLGRVFRRFAIGVRS